MAQEKGENMAQDKGKSIVTEPPMNPPPRLSPVPSQKPPHGCAGEGCASDPGTWPLHHTLRHGVHCLLCCSCILLSHRSMYCSRCLFLVTSPSSNYDDGDMFMAPPAPTVTCQVCRESVAHLPCLYNEPAFAADGVFVCPPCTAAQNGGRFTYAPPIRQPIDERGARVLVLAGRIALALLKRHAAAARTNAERLILEARDARKIADEALDVAYDLAKKENASWVLPQTPESEDDLAASEEEGGGSEAEATFLVRRNVMPSLATLTIGTAGGSVVPMALTDAKAKHAALGSEAGATLLVRRNVMPSLATLTIGMAGGSVVPMALTDAKAKHAPSSSQAKPPLFGVINEKAVENAAEAVQAEPRPPHRALINSFNMKEVAMAAAEAARASPPSPPQTLQLFPGAKASSSTKMVQRTKKPRTKRPRTLQLFKDDKKDM